jgi:opacity protein-like surface antigen
VKILQVITIFTLVTFSTNFAIAQSSLTKAKADYQEAKKSYSSSSVKSPILRANYKEAVLKYNLEKLKASYRKGKKKYKNSSTKSSSITNDGNLSPFYGVGIKYKISQSVGSYAEYERSKYEVDVSTSNASHLIQNFDINVIRAGISLNF